MTASRGGGWWSASSGNCVCTAMGQPTERSLLKGDASFCHPSDGTARNSRQPVRRRWQSMEEAQSDNYPDYGRPSPRVTENWLNRHLWRGTKWGSFHIMLEKPFSYSSGRETLLISLPVLLTISIGMKGNRYLLLFAELWISGYSKCRHNHTSLSPHFQRLWFCNLGWWLCIWKPTGVFNIFLCQEVWPQNSTAWIPFR